MRAGYTINEVVQSGNLLPEETPKYSRDDQLLPQLVA